MAKQTAPKRGGRKANLSNLAYSKDGVDLTLIRWMLSLTPRERIEVLQNNVRSILRLRGEQSGT